MARAVSEIEKEIRALEPDEQEHLLRALLEELDGPADPDVEQAWLAEAQRRSNFTLRQTPNCVRRRSTTRGAWRWLIDAGCRSTGEVESDGPPPIERVAEVSGRE
jgi:Putative addiction module component